MTTLWPLETRQYCGYGQQSPPRVSGHVQLSCEAAWFRSPVKGGNENVVKVLRRQHVVVGNTFEEDLP